MEEFFQVGIFTNTHGVRGEIKVFPTTDDLSRFKRLKEVIMRTKEGDITMKIAGTRMQKQMVLMRFAGIDNINEIEKYKGSGLYVHRKDAIPLEKNEYFIADLIGLAVEGDDGRQFGKLTEVLQTGSNDVYVVKNAEREWLFPAIPDCVQSVDIEAGRMIVHVMDGLEEL
ncbi:MAG: ribosome maturation factor RimM [Lachnospiraceae bacterium]|nr:ribosome maturation factor RimM [Lachnospiraceae bacterium]